MTPARAKAMGPVLRPDGHGACGAKKRDGSGDRCMNRAGMGTDHVGFGCCSKHGGNTPTQRRHAQRQAATAAVVRFGLAVEIAPHEALTQELHRAAGAVSYLEQHVRALDPADVASGSVWVDLWRSERETLADVAATCIAVGVEERLVRQTQEAGARLAAAFRLVLDRLGVYAHPDAPAAVREALTAFVADR